MENLNSTTCETFTDYSNRLQLDVLLVKAYESVLTRSLSEDEAGDTHHILPTCLGGSDDADNKVKLSVTDHAKAHCLLQAMQVGTKAYRDLAGASALTNSRISFIDYELDKTAQLLWSDYLTAWQVFDSLAKKHLTVLASKPEYVKGRCYVTSLSEIDEIWLKVYINEAAVCFSQLTRQTVKANEYLLKEHSSKALQYLRMHHRLVSLPSRSDILYFELVKDLLKLKHWRNSHNRKDQASPVDIFIRYAGL